MLPPPLSETVRNMLAAKWEFDRDQEIVSKCAPPYIGELKLDTGPRAFIFAEDFVEGDARFKRKENIEYVWTLHPAEKVFRLALAYDRFSFTLPYVVDGIK